MFFSSGIAPMPYAVILNHASNNCAKLISEVPRYTKRHFGLKRWTVLQELVKWQADIEAADKMYKDGQVALEKVALLQTQVDEAALREIQVIVLTVLILISLKWGT